MEDGTEGRDMCTLVVQREVSRSSALHLYYKSRYPALFSKQMNAVEEL